MLDHNDDLTFSCWPPIVKLWEAKFASVFESDENIENACLYTDDLPVDERVMINKFNIPKSALCAASPVFAAMLNGVDNEGDGNVEIDCEKEESVAFFDHFFHGCVKDIISIL